MAVRKVAILGHPVLRKKAAPVPEKEIQTAATQTLIKDMVDTMFDYNGLGLAAPQVHESLRIVVMLWGLDDSDSQESKLVCLINPEIKALSKDTSAFWEGCLSVPGMRGLVERPNHIHLCALTPDGSKFEQEVKGFQATVIQHECDHLDGIVYVDRLKDTTQFAFEKEYTRYFTES